MPANDALRDHQPPIRRSGNKGLQVRLTEQRIKRAAHKVELESALRAAKLALTAQEHSRARAQKALEAAEHEVERARAQVEAAEAALVQHSDE